MVNELSITRVAAIRGSISIASLRSHLLDWLKLLHVSRRADFPSGIPLMLCANLIGGAEETKLDVHFNGGKLESAEQVAAVLLKEVRTIYSIRTLGSQECAADFAVANAGVTVVGDFSCPSQMRAVVESIRTACTFVRKPRTCLYPLRKWSTGLLHKLCLPAIIPLSDLEIHLTGAVVAFFRARSALSALDNESTEFFVRMLLEGMEATNDLVRFPCQSLLRNGGGPIAASSSLVSLDVAGVWRGLYGELLSAAQLHTTNSGSALISVEVLVSTLTSSSFGALSPRQLAEVLAAAQMACCVTATTSDIRYCPPEALDGSATLAMRARAMAPLPWLATSTESATTTTQASPAFWFASIEPREAPKLNDDVDRLPSGVLCSLRRVYSPRELTKQSIPRWLLCGLACRLVARNCSHLCIYQNTLSLSQTILEGQVTTNVTAAVETDQLKIIVTCALTNESIKPSLEVEIAAMRAALELQTEVEDVLLELAQGIRWRVHVGSDVEGFDLETALTKFVCTPSTPEEEREAELVRKALLSWREGMTMDSIDQLSISFCSKTTTSDTKNRVTIASIARAMLPRFSASSFSSESRDSFALVARAIVSVIRSERCLVLDCLSQPTISLSHQQLVSLCDQVLSQSKLAMAVQGRSTTPLILPVITRCTHSEGSTLRSYDISALCAVCGASCPNKGTAQWHAFEGSAMENDLLCALSLPLLVLEKLVQCRPVPRAVVTLGTALQSNFELLFRSVFFTQAGVPRDGGSRERPLHLDFERLARLQCSTLRSMRDFIDNPLSTLSKLQPLSELREYVAPSISSDTYCRSLLALRRVVGVDEMLALEAPAQVSRNEDCLMAVLCGEEGCTTAFCEGGKDRAVLQLR